MKEPRARVILPWNTRQTISIGICKYHSLEDTQGVSKLIYLHCVGETRIDGGSHVSELGSIDEEDHIDDVPEDGRTAEASAHGNLQKRLVRSSVILTAHL